MRKRVVIAMSGGVDSSVAAAILKEEGYECIGISMQLWDYSKAEDDSGATEGSCCSLDDLYDARRVADLLDIPFYVVNLEGVFSKAVVDYFVDSYLKGLTPNPCIKCNEILKFNELLKRAAGLGADYLATGHYARIVSQGQGGGERTFRLLKGVDRAKDQSYFLFTMTQGQLARTLFPLGRLTKSEVRRYARRLGLRTAEKQESQEVCFIGSEGYHGFIEQRSHYGEGDIVDSSGNILGTHRGLHRYTIGQRRGLSLSGGPYYVIDMDTANNRLVVGREEELLSTGLIAGGFNWINRPAELPLRNVTVKIRYRHPGVGAEVFDRGDGTFEISFSTPQKAVTPGQAVVVYSEEELLGGGWILRALKG